MTRSCALCFLLLLMIVGCSTGYRGVSVFDIDRNLTTEEVEKVDIQEVYSRFIYLADRFGFEVADSRLEAVGTGSSYIRAECPEREISMFLSVDERSVRIGISEGRNLQESDHVTEIRRGIEVFFDQMSIPGNLRYRAERFRFD